MPIVEVEIVLKPNEDIRAELTSSLADAIGEIFGSPRGTTWVKLRGIPPSQYAENKIEHGNIFPVFIKIVKSKIPGQIQIKKEAERIAEASAQICGRSAENIHIIYEPEGSGRVVFGGKIIA